MSIFPLTSLWILLVKFARVAFEIVCFWSAAVCSLFFSLSLIINREVVGQVFDDALTRRSEITYEFRSRASILCRQVEFWKIVFSQIDAALFWPHDIIYVVITDFAIWRF